MKSERRLLEKVQLENGLTVLFYDCSRPIAGDRCQVELVLSIPVATSEGSFADCGEPRESYEAFVAARGKGLKFEQKRIRNFIAREEVPAVLRQMQEELLRASRSYLVREDFGAKFIAKQFKEWEDEQRLKSLMAGAGRADAAE
jgi:hypothetical protein